MEKFQLKVIKQTDKNILRVLENCLQFGIPILIEDVKEELNSLLDPVLLKIVTRQVCLILKHYLLAFNF
jgi:dynein heavy chain